MFVEFILEIEAFRIMGTVATRAGFDPINHRRIVRLVMVEYKRLLGRYALYSD